MQAAIQIIPSSLSIPFVSFLSPFPSATSQMALASSSWRIQAARWEKLLPLISNLISVTSFFFFLVFALPVIGATNQQDVNALVALHKAWSQKPSSWNTKTDPCASAWLGIQCDSTNTSVTSLLLINQQLEGTLPSAIGNLTNLINLDLSSNPKLGGDLPKEIGNLASLERLFIQFCNFSGLIPSEVGNLQKLGYLGLTQNAFVGNLPSTIGQLKSLIWLDVSSNQLNGSLPQSSNTSAGLDNLTNAQHFHLENNSFSGNIPSTIFSTRMSLLHLLLDNNKFAGSIPSSIGDVSPLQIIRLDNNLLSGSVPSSLSKLPNLTTLQLNSNNLTGQLPNLSNNTQLQMLYLSNNSFGTANIPSWITNLASLRLLSMDSMNLNGTIPAELFRSANISNMTLASNQLSGILNLSALSTNLLLVDVRNNNLTNVTGDNGTFLPQILLDGNPYCVSNRSQCIEYQNRVVSASVQSTSNCTAVCDNGYVINPNVNATNCLCALPVVASINFLATKIPVFTAVNIASIENTYATRLTALLVNFTSIQSYQVVVSVISYNRIQVSVFPPSGLKEWPSTIAAFISFHIKSQEISLDSYGPLVCQFNGNTYGAVVVVNKLSLGAKIGIAVAVVAFVVIVSVLGFYALRQKKRAETAEKLNKPFAAWIAAGEGDPNIPQLKGARWFSLDEIKKCTNSFSQNNEIGEGGFGKVYKGYLESGVAVAIKRAAADSLQGVNEFRNEIELLSRVHHRNLVGLIGFCFEEGEQMLVYEFMPNGTLRENLTGKSCINMDWERRLQLALGAARGIAYLHAEANPPIIHRDIKSSNILLDDKLVAKVADFGLSKLAPVDDDGPPLSTQVKGTLGYLDPDYFMTNRLTEKSDVYSFGVVLLELVTGMLPIQDGKYVVREVRTSFTQGGIESVVKLLVDPSLRDCPLKALEGMVELALDCIQDDPDSRPNMSEVVKEIESIMGVTNSSVKKPSSRDTHSVVVEYPYEEDGIALTQRNGTGTSFEYSGSVVGISTALLPK